MFLRVVCALLASLLLLTAGAQAYAYEKLPYECYNFDHWGVEVPSPAAYAPADSLSGADLGAGAFSLPTDLYVRGDALYVLDGGNNRVVVVDLKTRKLRRTIGGFLREDGAEDSFLEPSGLFVTEDYELYIADTGNKRVVALDAEDRFLKELKDPKDESIPENFVFTPVKVVVDPAGRIYCTVRNVFEGIMSFDKDGSFFGYFGTINVTFNPLDYLWRVLSTKEQRSRSKLFIPTEFSNMDIDAEGFIYTTNVDISATQYIKKLNPAGADVITNYTTQKIIGDLTYRAYGRSGGRSVFVDITVRNAGMYSALDSTRGRIYTYDSEGNLLYIFGGLGSVFGTFKTPAALDVYGDKLLVLDQYRAEILVFEPTPYGSLINRAIGLRYDGDESAAVELWKDVLALDANFLPAYDGIAKSYLVEGDNKAAMEYFRKARNKTYYSVALKRYRSDVLAANINYILSGAVLLGIFAVWRLARSGKKAKKAGESIA